MESGLGASFLLVHGKSKKEGEEARVEEERGRSCRRRRDKAVSNVSVKRFALYRLLI